MRPLLTDQYITTFPLQREQAALGRDLVYFAEQNILFDTQLTDLAVLVNANSGATGVTFAGDLSGTTLTQTVVGLQNNPINPAAPALNDILQWDGAAWTPTPIAAGGTVLTVAIATANGFAGTSDGNPVNPTLTLTTTVTGILKGNGTAINAAVGDTDYQNPILLTTVGSSGAATFIADVLNVPVYQAAGSYLSDALTSAHIFVGSAGNIATDTAMTGDITITNAGVTAIGNLKVVTAMINTNAVTYAKMQQASTVTLLGNPTGGAANISEITLGAGLNFSGTTLVATGSGGTVTAVSVATANGFAGSSSGGTTPALTISTTITASVLKGNGTAISASVAGTDYQAPITLTTTGSSGASTFAANTLNIPNYTIAGLSPLTTKGDLFTFSTVNTRLAVGATDGMILGVSSAAATGLVWSIPTYPMARGSSGVILRSDGTNNVYSNSSFADTYAANTLLYATSANTISGFAMGTALQQIRVNAGATSLEYFTPTTSITALGAIGSSPNANAATLTGGTLNLEPASASFGGVVTTGAQTFAGDKTFSGGIIFKDGSASSPGLQTSDGNTGFYRVSAGQIGMSTNGTIRLTLNNTFLTSSTAGGVSISHASTTNSAPTYSFVNNTTTGMYLSNTSELSFTTASTKRLTVTSDGRLYGVALHNNAGAVTGTTNQYIASGTYTPTLTNVTNVTASTAYACQWMRVGNVVTVSGKVDIDVTLGVASELGMSLPIASALTAENQLGGTASSAAAASLTSAIRADATNDRAAFVFTAVSLTNDSYFFTFTYVVL